MAEEDDKILEGVNELDARAMNHHNDTQSCHREVPIWAANYTKKGKAGRQQELFPQLEEEMRKGRQEQEKAWFGRISLPKKSKMKS